MAESQVLVEAQGLAKRFADFEAVKDLSFSVKRGEVVGILGPNGAGKTTTMRMLTGYLEPNSGKACIGGLDVSKERLKAQRMLGYLPENAPLYDEMMVVDYLRFVAEIRQLDPATRQQKLRTICERCGLMDVLGKDVGHLSKGYRQRVGLAQALLHDPDLLILDEPTSGLDPNQIIEIRKLIKELGQDKTVLLSTHILPEVQATCDRILIISNGKLVADDTPEALTAGESGAVIQVVVKSAGALEQEAARLRELFEKVKGVGRVESQEGEGNGTLGFRLTAQGNSDPRAELFGCAVEHELVLLNMNKERVSLEDTFRSLTLGEGESHE
ncbi:MAG: ATP-binding cassette domain-containing protein [Myxococcota bacterium]|jgi:ABC-2 type transport system ATP-binding protein|nr:ATP-binding cassette domain-containing protein [Myxococcota bacterium]